jgi:hypothetical protein
MIRLTLLGVAGIFAVACSACAPAPVPTPIIGPSSGSGTGTPNCTATEFAASVQVLGAAFDPTKLKPPPAGTPLDKNTNGGAWQDLSDAFDAAPAKFKERLCMTSVLIDPYYDQKNPLSWGFRKPNTMERFIGLPSFLWGGGTLTSNAGKYSAYETDVFARIFERATGQKWDTNSAYPPIYGEPKSSGTSVDTSGMTVLAILAHEYGHTLFYELFKGNDPYPPNTATKAWGFCRSPAAARNGYFDNTWLSITIPPDYWTYFGAATDLHANNLVQIGDIQNELSPNKPKPNWGNIATYVAALYANDNYPAPSGRVQSGRWPSLYGAISPIEDFVEAFKFAVLTHPGTNRGKPVTSMPIYITSGLTSGAAFDVFADENNGNKQHLHRRKLCIHNRILQ